MKADTKYRIKTYSLAIAGVSISTGFMYFCFLGVKSYIKHVTPSQLELKCEDTFKFDSDQYQLKCDEEGNPIGIELYKEE